MMKSLPSGDRQTLDIARSSGESGYSWISSQFRWICSVFPKSPSLSRMKCFFHGIEGIFLAGKDGKFSQSRDRPPARNLFRVLSCSQNCPPAKKVLTDIRFWVRVPVLSTQRTVAEPRVSMAGIWRVSTFFWEILHAPRARNMVRTTGNSSGRIAMASVMPARNPSSQLNRVRP